MLYIMESTSGGVGFIDCDNDGKLDIVVANGSTVDRFRHGGDPMVTLYHQDADLKFTDITENAGLTRKGWGMGVAVADYRQRRLAGSLCNRLRRQRSLSQSGKLQV